MECQGCGKPIKIQIFQGGLWCSIDCQKKILKNAPCKGKNTNICVAEGCYNASCLKLKEV